MAAKNVQDMVFKRRIAVAKKVFNIIIKQFANKESDKLLRQKSTIYL